MTNQEKKKYLLQYRGLEGEIDRLIEELGEQRAKAQKMTAAYSDLPKGQPAGDSLARAVERMIELEEKLNARINKQVDLRMEIERGIEAVNNPKLRIILRDRYIEGKTWDDIAERMHYAKRHIIRLHGYALSQLQIDFEKMSSNVT